MIFIGRCVPRPTFRLDLLPLEYLTACLLTAMDINPYDGVFRPRHPGSRCFHPERDFATVHSQTIELVANAESDSQWRGLDERFMDGVAYRYRINDIQSGVSLMDSRVFALDALHYRYGEPLLLIEIRRVNDRGNKRPDKVIHIA